MSQSKLSEQLADKVANTVIKSGVREDILQALLKAVENNVREAAAEALLVAIGHATMERDKAWVQQLRGEWSPKSGLKPATTPAEVEQEIRAWHAARVSEVRNTSYKAGYDDAFPTAIRTGAKFGWAAHESGSNLEATLAAAEKVKP